MTECIISLYIKECSGKSYEYYILQLTTILQNNLQVWETKETKRTTIHEALLMSQLHIGSDGRHEADTMNGTGATVAEIRDTLTTTISAGAKCNSEHGMSSLTT